MTAGELRDLIIRRLAREQGGGTIRWRKALGELRVYSRTTHAHCNWEARPSGSIAEIGVVEAAVDAERARHPYVED